jgi:hypothetical protein
VVEELVGEIESFPLRLAAGVVVILGIFTVFGVGVGLTLSAVAWTLRLCGISVE